jgi:hypothetical protein
VAVLVNKRYELFAVRVAAGDEIADAYAAAGFHTKSRDVARAAAGRLMMRDDVKARVEELRTKIVDAATDHAVLSKAWVITQARELFIAARTSGNLAAATRLLELLGREVRAFVERKNVTVRSLRDMSEEDLQEMLDELAADSGDEDPSGAGDTG